MATPPRNGSKTAARSTVGFLVVALAVAGGSYGVLRVTKLDPFASYRRAGGELDQVAMELTDVKVRQFRAGKMVGSANVGLIKVFKDRQGADLVNITDGVYRGDNGDVSYTSSTANWNQTRKILTVPQGARVHSKDFDLSVPRFVYDGGHQRLNVPGAISGKLLEGQVHAASFAYNLNTKSWMLGETEWTGPISVDLQDGSAPQREVWTIKGRGSGNNEVITYKNGYAVNEAGDTIIRAEQIVQNRRESTITATGNVKYFSSKANMTCEKAVIYTKEKRAVLTGGVDMIVKPKDSPDKAKEEEIPPFRPLVPDSVAAGRPPAPTDAQRQGDQEGRSGETIRKYPIAVNAGEIEYWYKKGNRHAVITGTPQALQSLPGGRWRRAWAAVAYYDGEAETLKMETRGGTVTRLRTWLGDDVTADWFVISTREGNEEWSGDGIQGKIVMEPDDNGGGTPPPGTKGTTGGGGGKLSGRIGG